MFPARTVFKTLALTFLPLNGLFLHLLRKVSPLISKGVSKSNRTKLAGYFFCSLPSYNPRSFAGLHVKGAKASSNEIEFSCTFSSVTGSNVSKPTTPKDA